MSNNHLVIGLGGSGGKIIRQLKKRIQHDQNSKSGSKTGVNFEFLYVDTSRDELNKKEEWIVLGKDIELSTSQVIINSAGEIHPVLNDADAFPGLKSWIEPRSIFDFVKPGIAGAAQRRKLGRLVFAQNAAQFVNQFKDRLSTLERASNSVGGTIHIVCGLAGGTGSGSIVDAVAQIRNQYQNPDQYRILIYAILPEKNSTRVKDVSGHSTYYANGYAALAELNAMSVGLYHPVNVLDGSNMSHDTYFNGCYLVDNINEHSVPFGIEHDVPKVIAEFIYQKSINNSWEGLGRAEKGENDIKNFELEQGEKGNSEKTRSKLFLSFGFERVVVPEEEIKEYLSYGLATQVTRQLMFNNFRENEGFTDEIFQKDWGSEIRKPDELQKFLLSDTHLMLESGILEDDAKNETWKPISEYWKLVAGVHKQQITEDKKIEETNWISELNNRLAKSYDEQYRSLVGVKKFYEIKSKASLEMASSISRNIERHFFTRWKAGDASLSQLILYIDSAIDYISERNDIYLENIGKTPKSLQSLHAKIDKIKQEFNQVGTLVQIFSDRRKRLFEEITENHQSLYALLTQLEGWKFATNLIPLLKDKLLELRGNINDLNQMLAATTEKLLEDRAAQLDSRASVYQTRIFDKPAIDNVLKKIITDENRMRSQAQEIRNAIILLAGESTDSFDKLVGAASKSSMLLKLSEKSAEFVEATHTEIAQASSRDAVLNVNIIDRLRRQFDANERDLKDFVRNLYKEAGCMVTFNKSEMDRNVTGNEGGIQGRIQTVGVYLPECDASKDFREKLNALFESEKDTPDTKIVSGSVENEIIVIRISSLMPVRFIDSVNEYKRHYDGLLKDHRESYLLHGEGNGAMLPSLYAKTAKQIKAISLRKPYIFLAYLSEMIKQRQNRKTGLMEWVFIQEMDGLPVSKVIDHSPTVPVYHASIDDAFFEEIKIAVDRTIKSDYVHQDKKNELMDKHHKQAMARYAEAGGDDQDDEYQELFIMKQPLKEIIGVVSQ